jgi:hypothetical protein
LNEQVLGAESIDRIKKLAEAADLINNPTIEITQNGETLTYDRESLNPIFHDPRPTTLTVNTLSAIKDYLLTAGHDGHDKDDITIAVRSPSHVVVYGKAKGPELKRTFYIEAKDERREAYPFGKWIEPEEFIIRMYSTFQPTKNRDDILQIVSGLKNEASIKTTDSGSTMKKESVNGVISESEIRCSIPFLKPWRTFNEIDQPESAFLFRYRADDDGVEIALFEADGQAWQIEAMENIAKFFREKTINYNVLC